MGEKQTFHTHKYVGIVKGFISWYGEDLDIKVKLPHQLPAYIEEADIYRMLDALAGKKSHKKTIDRDTLLIELAYKSGLRRSELANLKVGDVLTEERAIIVRSGKGGKDRTVPLPSSIVSKLRSFIEGRKAEETLFGLSDLSISDKIHRISKKAGVNIHTHSLRHGYATRLLEKGANVKAVQELLGHARLGTTEGYLGLLPHHLREAVDLLDKASDETEQLLKDREHGITGETLHIAVADVETALLSRDTFLASDSILN